MLPISAAGSETSSQVVNVNATTRERDGSQLLNIYIVEAAVHATNDPGVIMHASSASAGHWISALIFFAFDIGTRLFHTRRRLVCPDEESIRIIAQGMRALWCIHG